MAPRDSDCASDDQQQQLLQQATAAALPAVFRGVNRAWPARERWDGAAGLTYLQQLAGSAPVQAMLSSSSDFSGDFQHHQEVDCTFGELLQQSQKQQQRGAGADTASAPPAEGAAAAVASPHLYLAQQPLLDGTALGALLRDVPVPPLLANHNLTSTNLWFSGQPSRSSLHYDPYDNLLCVVTGAKAVTLHPPCATLGLSPRPLGSEAANHSSVPLPALAGNDGDGAAGGAGAAHPLLRHVRPQGLHVTLGPGDALFIPEGWWHQVDSQGMTFAVNFWWASQLAQLLACQPHQAHYWLRQLLAAASSEAVTQLLGSIQPWRGQEEGGPGSAAARAQHQHTHAGPQQGSSKRARHNPDQQQEPALSGALTAFERGAMAALLEPQPQQHEAAAGQQQQLEQEPEQQHEGAQEEGTRVLADEAWWQRQRRVQQQLLAAAVRLQHSPTHNSSSSSSAGDTPPGRRDPLGLDGGAARALAALAPAQLVRVLWAAAHEQPAAVAALLLTGLTPAAAQLLTRRFDEADACFSSSSSTRPDGPDESKDAPPLPSRGAFYSRVYGTVGDPSRVLAALLPQQEALWGAVARTVVAAHLG